MSGIETRKKRNPELIAGHEPYERAKEMFVKKETREGYTHHYREHVLSHGVNGKEFRYYDIVRLINRGPRVTVGRVTAHTTPERLASLYYRFYHPEHLQPFQFSGTVRFTTEGEPDPEKPALILHPYITIPAEISQACDVRVDDEIEITVTNSEGWTLTDVYHVSQMDDYLIVPLVKFRRAVIQEYPEGKKLTFQASNLYREDSRRLQTSPQEGRPRFMFTKSIKGPDGKPTGEILTVPYTRFINPGDRVTVICRPDPEGDGRLDFAYETLVRLSRERAKGSGNPPEFVPKLTRNGWTSPPHKE